MLAPIGFGKTFTIAYVVQYLKSGGGDVASNTPTTDTLSVTAPSALQPRRNVYFHYCKDDGTTNKALNVFNGLASQLLKDHKDLRAYFDNRAQKQETDGYHPTSNPSRVKDLLIDLVGMLPPPMFLIIDALDECLPNDRRVLLDFLEQIPEQIPGRTTSIRILTSARASHLDQSEKLYPKMAVPICSWYLRAVRQRDGIIAEFLVEHHMRHVSDDEDVRQLLVKNLTSGMRGSAMWARMTIEDIVTAGLTSPDSIRYYLKENELPKPLTELYLRVFKNVTGGQEANQWLLARSLELIAGARRRLSFDEMLYALSLYTPLSRREVSRAKDLSELRNILRSQVDENRVRKLLRPFADLKPTFGFVHESLKAAVLEFPPLTDAASSRQQGWTGVSGIEGVMLRTCVDYLMLEDFNWPETIPDDKGVRGKMSQVHQKMWDDHPKISGPFGAFFDYAARCWTDHLGSAPVGFNLDDILELASPTSARNKAWRLPRPVPAWYPACSPAMKPSALCLIVGFGNVSILEQQLDRLAQNGDVDRRLLVDAAKIAIGCDKPGNFQTLMNHRSTAMDMHTAEMLKISMRCISSGPGWRRNKSEEWAGLIRGLFDKLAPDTIPSPNELLRDAYEVRCMPVIEKLCERAKADPAFQKRLMQPTGGIGPLGKLAGCNDVAALRYLCQQDGIEAHASNRDIYGGNILGFLYYPKLEIIELLVDKFPWLASERGGVAPNRRPDMCQTPILDPHADAREVVNVWSSGQLEFKEIEDRPPVNYLESDEKLSGPICYGIGGWIEDLSAMDTASLPS